MRTILAILLLVAFTGCSAMAQERIAVNEAGMLTIRTPGKGEMPCSLFVHHDDWVWRGAEQLRRPAENRWSGVIAKREEDGPGSISFVQTVERVARGVRVEYEFTRQGEMDLRQGVILAVVFPYPDFRGRQIVFTHGPPADTDRNFRAAARGCTVNLSETEALQIEFGQATRFTTWISEDRSFSLNVRLAPRDMGDAAKAVLTLRLVPAVREVRPWVARPQRAPLTLAGVTADRQVVGLYEPVEFTLELSATYENPFDPEQVAVDATVTTPSGRTERVPGFYCQGFEAEYENGEELLSLDGEPTWKVRYTPREVGAYSVAFEARDGSGRAASPPLSFRCAQSGAGGFARLSSAQDSAPIYFRLDNGESLFLIGHNVTGYPINVDEVFRRMAAGGENYTRFWMHSGAFGLEWALPVGHYREQRAWQLDRTLESARQHGIYLMLCFDTHQDVQGRNWESNPYNAARGGPCEGVMDIFRSEEAGSLYRKRLRYIIARWGYHPNVLCWEFVNEIEGWAGAEENKELLADWHAEMARFIRENDPFDHPITTSQWTTEGWPELWGLPEMQFVQSHYYANNMWADMAGDVERICRQKLEDYPRKLHLFGEYGIASGAGTRRMDPAGIHLHNGNWAALMAGCASNPVSWWHDSYIHAVDLYRVYRGLADFVEGEPLAERAWRPADVHSVAYVRPLKDIFFTDLQFRGSKGSWTAPIPEGTRFVVRRDGTVENLDELQDLLHGQGHADLRSPFVFEVDCRRPCRFSVNVGTVSAGGVLEFEMDGRMVATFELPTGEGLGKESRWQEQWDIWQTDYDEAHGIDVPAGRHTIKLENQGKDWVQINYFRLEDYVTNERPPLRVLGIAADDRALLWAQNGAHTWFNVREGNPMPPVEPTVVRLDGFADGRWQVEFWDTVAGEVVARKEAPAEDGRLELELPAIETDIALKLTR